MEFQSEVFMLTMIQMMHPNSSFYLSNLQQLYCQFQYPNSNQTRHTTYKLTITLKLESRRNIYFVYYFYKLEIYHGLN